MLQDIDKDTVDFMPNFDETLMQPKVLPSRFPNLLVNGSSGIAVGMATNIPPHNLGEVIDGAICLIDHPDATLDDLMEHIKGPDFPTGGVILGRSGIREAYHTGRGRIVTRAKTEIEQLALDLSDVVSYHCYGSYQDNVDYLLQLRQIGRPAMNTEWMNRLNPTNTVPYLFPLFFLENIGSFSFGFVAGKMCYNEPAQGIWLEYEKKRL